MRITVTKDVEKKESLRKQMKENGGYCPCATKHTEDTKCMCKAFREQEEGECHCGLYIKTNND